MARYFIPPKYRYYTDIPTIINKRELNESLLDFEGKFREMVENIDARLEERDRRARGRREKMTGKLRQITGDVSILRQVAVSRKRSNL